MKSISSFIRTRGKWSFRNLDKIQAKIPGYWSPRFFFLSSVVLGQPQPLWSKERFFHEICDFPGRNGQMQRPSQESGALTCLAISTHPGCYIIFGKALRWVWGYDGGRYYNSRDKLGDDYWTLKLAVRGKCIPPHYRRGSYLTTMDHLVGCGWGRWLFQMEEQNWMGGIWEVRDTENFCPRLVQGSKQVPWRKFPQGRR